MKNIYVTKALLPTYEEYCEAIKPLWESHHITNMGAHHKQFKREIQNYLGAKNVSLFCNGHMALELTLQAMELKGEVITTPFTFVSTTHAIVRNGLVPVFCDINKDDYTIDADKIESLITEKTCAILPVHVYGHVCEVEKIDKIAKKHNLKVIYDAAHAFGVSYKNTPVSLFGDASMFSFHATKVFNTIEGGAITFLDDKLGGRLYNLKNFGIKSPVEVEYVGANAKMNEFSAIMGLCNLKQIDYAISERKRVYERYLDNLRQVQGLIFCKSRPEQTRNYAYLPVLVAKEFGKTRDEIFDALAEQNIFVRKYFYPIMTELDCYADNKFTKNTPVAKSVSQKILTLPIYPTLENGEVDRICSVVRRVYENKHQKTNFASDCEY